MRIIDALADRILYLLNEKGMSQYQLEQSSFIPHGTLSKILRRQNKSVELKTILKLAKGFNMSLIEFLDNSQILVENFNLDD